MARSKTEINKIASLLEEDWESAEVLAKTIIDTLDELRASKTRHVAVMQFGGTHPFYVGVGPYPTQNAAQKALSKHPAASDATARAVVPVMTDEGLQALLATIDEVPESVLKENATTKKAANQKFAALMSKERQHIVVKNASDIKIVRK